MSTNLGETVKQLTDFLKTEATTETVIGQQFQLGEFTCVPVIKFGVGLGYGGGEGSGEMPNKSKGEGGGSGAGAGIGVMPIGFLVTRAGEISFVHTSSSKGLNAAFEKLPDLLEKFMKKNNAPKEPVTA
ncbi:MAG TPA: GerW family sporulation protein [Chitinophagaceae bacterium]|nr:GerW family sporulation protein [Chitinophagaceae bacterium]